MRNKRNAPLFFFTVIKRKIYRYIGLYDSSLSFESRLFNLVVLSGSVLLLGALIINLLIGYTLLSLLIAANILVLSGSFYLSRYTSKYQKVVLPVLLFGVLSLCFSWFLNSGINGPILYYFFLIVVLGMIIIRTQYHPFFLLFTIGIVIMLVVVELSFPHLVTYYDNEMTALADILISAIIILISLGSVVGLFKKSYEADRSALTFSKERLIETQKKAEAATIAKSKFLSNMSHEIRTPLNAIIGSAELLKTTPVTKEQKELFKILESSSNLLLNIINDVLDLSKIEAGKLELQYAPCNIETIMKEVMKIISATLTKNIRLSYTIDKDVRNEVMADESRIKQVLLNLVGNAIKFTEKGSITISIKQVSQEGNMQQLRFDVTDTGIGISKAGLDQLFLPFSQIEGTATRKYGGTGLGLSICKKLLEMMGGTIWAEGEENKGSVFSFIVPVEVLSENEKVQPEVITPAIYETTMPSTQIKILLAEDNMVNQQIIERIFKHLGYKITIVTNGKSAFEKACDTVYDMIFMDIQMPEMDGMEATRHILRFHKQNYLKPPVIIAITAGAMKEDIVKYYEAGMNDFIAKPFLIEQLKMILQKWGNN